MTPNTSTTPKFFLMCCNMYLHEPLDENLVKEWFPLHFINCPRLRYATGFFMAETEPEVLETLLKVQHLLGFTFLLPEETFVRLLGDCMDSHYDPWSLSWASEERTVVTVHSWRERMRIREERKTGGDGLIHDELSDDHVDPGSPQALGLADGHEGSSTYRSEEEDQMSVDSDDGHDETDDEEDSEEEDAEEGFPSTEARQLQHKPPPQDSAFDRAFTDKMTLCLSEECNVPACSVAGYFM